MEKTAEEIECSKLRDKLTKQFHKASADYGLIEEGDHILIGLSGGKDSLALTEMLGRRAQIYVPRFKVTAIHVRVSERNYQSDTSYLEQFCRRWQVPLLVRDTTIGEERGEKDPCFLCAWYRRKVLFDVAQELGCNKIALGHHKDDILCTLLMNQFFQGSLSTMPPLLQMEKMPLRIIRPLCLIEEKQLARYAELSHYRKQTKLCPFEHDTSRNAVRQLMTQIEQLNPDFRDSLWGAMENIKTDYLPHKKLKCLKVQKLNL